MILDIGCGERKRGDIGVDFRRVPGVDVVADVSSLPFKEESFEEALAFDILEHFPRHGTLDVLFEWKRILKSKGVLSIKAPNLTTLASFYVRKIIPGVEFARKLYGNQGNVGDFHKAGFDPLMLEEYLTKAGFSVIDHAWDASDKTGESGDWSNLWVLAQKII